MKKFLLLASAAMMATAAMADVETGVYETTNGITLKNLWSYSLFQGNYDNSNLEFAVNMDYDRARQATIANGKYIIGYSHKIMKGDELNSGSAHVVILDLMTGKQEKCLQLTYNGETIDDLLASNSINTDDFGHVWFTSYHNDFVKTTGEDRPINVYVIKDFETGECDLAFSLTLPADESEEASARTDFYDLVGDVYGEQAGTVFMCPGCENSTQPVVFGWQRDQGSDKWEPHMSDGGYVTQPLEDTYPTGQITLNYGSMLYIIRDEEYSGSLFYVDGFTTHPTLYDINGTMLDSMAELDADSDCLPAEESCNGALEFTISGKTFLAYPLNQHGKGTCQIAVAEYGEDGGFAGMKKYWTVPQDGLGNTSDGGIRLHSLSYVPYTDENGKEGVILAHFRCRNGLGAYVMGEDGINVGGVNDVIADDLQENAPVEYFNLQGMRVDNPVAGQMVIKRQGSKVAKELVK